MQPPEEDDDPVADEDDEDGVVEEDDPDPVEELLMTGSLKDKVKRQGGSKSMHWKCS